VWLAAGSACGALIGLSIPPYGWWPLAFLGCAGLALILPGRPARIRALVGFGAGLTQYVIGLWWVFEFSVPGALALMVLGAGFVTVALLLVPAGRRLAVVVALPAVFVLSDWLRARFPLNGFPMGGMSLGQAASPIAPTLRLGGGLLLTGETVLIGVALAELGRVGWAWPAARSSWTSGGSSRQKALRAVAAFGVLSAVAVFVPLLGWVSPSGQGGHLSPLRVALVQGGGPRGTRAINTDPTVVFDRHLEASQSLQPPLDLVVWPEGVLQSHDPLATSDEASEVSDLAQRLGATVLVGVEQDVGTHHYLNEVVAWGPDGKIHGTYVKNHLVPFGEYVPWRSFLSKFFNLAEVPLDAIAGHSPGFLRTPAAPLGIMISYEVFFDERARSGVRAGGQVLVVPTNTASYRSSQVPTQELAAARLRAWETGRWLLQVTPTGYSAIVGPTGKVVQRTTLGEQRVIEGTVPRETGRTVYVILGDTPIALLALLVTAASWAFVRRDRREHHHDRWSRLS
jgi:apolipoprotein N-acyltransferase